MSGKLLQLLKEGVPALTKVAILWDETIGRDQLDATEGAARAVGLTLKSLGVRRAQDLTGAFGTAARERVTGLVVLTSPLLSLNRARISELALKHRLPGITLFTNFPAFGFLMAYGPNQPDAFRRAASQYVARILSGARPAELPVQRPEKVRARHQPEDGEGAGPHDPARPPVACRSGDRMTKTSGRKCGALGTTLDQRGARLTGPRLDEPTAHSD
jgi:ABC-type uncharacterized transport system substrate-binding protein